MKEFDREGYTDVIIVPVFLTVSPHTFDDIPTIVGLKEDPHSMQQLKQERQQSGQRREGVLPEGKERN